MAKQNRPNIPLREWRTQQGKTQAEVAAHIGVDARTYLRWENGQSQPRPYARHKLTTLTHLPLPILMAAYEPLHIPAAGPPPAHDQQVKEHRRSEEQAAPPIEESPSLTRSTGNATPSHGFLCALIKALLVATSLLLVSLLLVIILSVRHQRTSVTPWLALLISSLALLSQWTIWWLSRHRHNRE